MGKKARLAALIVAAMTVIVTIVHIVLTLLLQDTRIGTYIVIGMVMVTAVVAFSLTYMDKQPVLPAMEGHSLQVSTWILMALGIVLVITSIYDAFMWMRFEVIPTPNGTFTGSAERICLIGTLVCGFFAGVFCMRQSWFWLQSGQFTLGESRVLPLALPLWLWMRLARYVVSYSSAVSMTKTFFDYAMLIASLLFAMSLARYLSGMTTYRSPALFWQALLTVLCGVSGALTRFAVCLAGKTAVQQVNELATFADLMFAGFAACVAAALLQGKRAADQFVKAADTAEPEPQPEPESEPQTPSEEPMPEMPVVDTNEN